MNALESLGAHGPAAAPALDVITAALTDASPIIRYWGTYAAGRLGVAAHALIPQLESLTRDREPGPSYGAIDALKRLRG